MKKQVLIFAFTIIFAVMLCGAVSATSSSISADGKTISVKHNYVTSTLKDKVSVTKKTGTYGYGYYGTVVTSGKDIKGNNIYTTRVYFNKNHNYFTFNDFKTGTHKQSNADGSWTKSSDKVTSNYKMISTTTGKTFNGLTYSGTANYTLYYASNGQRIFNNCAMTVKYFENGVYYATVTGTIKPTYKYIGGYQIIKLTITANTLYANKDTRKSIILQSYTRNSKGTLIGMKTGGTSSGTETVDGETVSYTGKITIQTKYDPKDTWSEKYTTGNYYETRTSTSPSLIRRIPLEAC